MPATRHAFQEKIREVGTWFAAALLGIGVAMSLTLVFLPGGMMFIFAGAALGTLTWGLSYLVPACFSYREITCPYCREVNHVLKGALEYNCDGCGHRLPGEAFWRNHGGNRLAGKKQPPRGGVRVGKVRKIG